MIDNGQFQSRGRWKRILSERTYLVGRLGVRRPVSGGGRSGRECDPSNRHQTPYSHFGSGTTLHKVRKAVFLRSVGSTMLWTNDLERGLTFARPSPPPPPGPPSSRTYHLPSSPIDPSLGTPSRSRLSPGVIRLPARYRSSPAARISDELLHPFNSRPNASSDVDDD